MAYNFVRNSYGYFDKQLFETMWWYAENQCWLGTSRYLDLTLVDMENNVVIYKPVKDIQFLLYKKDEQPDSLVLRIEHIKVTFLRADNYDNYICLVESTKQPPTQCFYPTLITLFN